MFHVARFPANSLHNFPFHFQPYYWTLSTCSFFSCGACFFVVFSWWQFGLTSIFCFIILMYEQKRVVMNDIFLNDKKGSLWTALPSKIHYNVILMSRILFLLWYNSLQVKFHLFVSNISLNARYFFSVNQLARILLFSSSCLCHDDNHWVSSVFSDKNPSFHWCILKHHNTTVFILLSNISIQKIHL